MEGLISEWSISWSSVLLIIPAALLFHFLFKHRHSSQRTAKLRGSLKPVPIVTGNGWLPFLGHALSYSRDKQGFLRRCEEQYGPIFQIQLFSTTYAIMTDREFVNEFMAAGEEELSFFSIFKEMYFYDVYANNKLSFPDMFKLVIRNGVAADWVGIQYLRNKVGHEIRHLFHNLSPVPGKKLDFREEMRFFVANTNARIFLGEPLSSPCFSDLIKFFELFNTVIMASVILPKSVIDLFLLKRLSALRDVAAAGFFKEIQKYRSDPGKSDSHILRTLVDYTESGSGASLSDIEIGRTHRYVLKVDGGTKSRPGYAWGARLGLWSKSTIGGYREIATENTVIGFCSLVADLSLHPEIWTKCKKEVEKYWNLSENPQDLQDLNFEALLGSDYLQAVVLETARLNAETIQAARKPGPGASIKGYYVGDTDVLAMAPGLLHVSGRSAQKLFKEPGIFNPGRFLRTPSSPGELCSPTAILTWGAGAHYCPGKSLAIAQIKLALSAVLLGLRRESAQFQIEKGLFSPGVIVDRNVKAVFI